MNDKRTLEERVESLESGLAMVYWLAVGAGALALFLLVLFMGKA